MPARTCPVCQHGTLEPFLELAGVPVLTTVFYPGREAAMEAPRGDLLLALCRHCGLVWNVAFDPSLVEYTPAYENSQHFSSTFAAYAEQLAARLAATYDLAGRTVVEVGSGKGEFLAQLVDLTGCRAVGFDPTFSGEVADPGDRLSIVRAYYDLETARGLDPALVIARHVLEHVPDPVGFLTAVREAGGPATALYCEVPNADTVFSDDGMWDLIYQHVGYFAAPSLELVVRRAGYEVTVVRPSFHDQFLGIEARPRSDAYGGEALDAEAVAQTCTRVASFTDRFRARLDGWRRRLEDQRTGETVLWGAGAKGVAFLNFLDAVGLIDRVVDVNPRKVGRYVPGTAHRVEAPDSLRGRRVATVLTMNPAYQSEIRADLARIGTPAPVEVV